MDRIFLRKKIIIVLRRRVAEKKWKNESTLSAQRITVWIFGKHLIYQVENDFVKFWKATRNITLR